MVKLLFTKNPVLEEPWPKQGFTYYVLFNAKKPSFLELGRKAHGDFRMGYLAPIPKVLMTNKRQQEDNL